MKITFENIFKGISNNKELIKKSFIILLIVYFVAMFAIFRSNFYYVDDMGRNMNGYKEWSLFSRFTSEFLSTFVHADTYLSDIAPLPQFLAIVFLILASIITIKLLTDDKKFDIWKIVAVVPLGLSPYFLECLSYRYDSIYMALSILVSIAPFLAYKRKKIVFIILSIIGTLIMCTTYQSSSGIFLMLAVILSFKMWSNKEETKEILKFAFSSFVSYGIGILIFKLFIMNPIDIYISNQIFAIDKLIEGVYSNYITFFNNIQSDFKTSWKIVIALILISFVVTSVIKTKRNKYVGGIVSVIIAVIVVLLSFGLYPFLTKPLFDPRAMYGFGISIAFLSVLAVDYKKAYIPKIVCSILAYMFITFSLTYGNALAEQKRYTDYRIQLVINDLKNIELFNTDKMKIIKIKGDIGKSNVINNANNKMLNRLIPNTFGGDLDWSMFYFYCYFGLDEKGVKMYNDELDENEMKLINDTMFHSIHQKDNYILIKLK